MNVKGTKKKNQAVTANIFGQQELLKKAEVFRESLTASTWHELETNGKFDKNKKLSFISDDMLILGCDVGSETHYMRAIDTRGRELSKSAFPFDNDSEGFQSAKEWAVKIAAEHNKSQIVLGLEPTGKFHSNIPTEIIKRALKPIINNYDYVLIDCPPNMGLITLNGLRISDAYIIPAIPDVLSTYGIPQIVNRVSEFSENIGEDIDCLGIVATKVRGQSSLHSRTIDVLKREKDAHFFSTIFYENNQMGEAAECIEVNTLRQKWGYQGQFDRFDSFVMEIMEMTEG